MEEVIAIIAECLDGGSNDNNSRVSRIVDVATRAVATRALKCKPSAGDMIIKIMQCM